MFARQQTGPFEVGDQGFKVRPGSLVVFFSSHIQLQGSAWNRQRAGFHQENAPPHSNTPSTVREGRGGSLPQTRAQLEYRRGSWSKGTASEDKLSQDARHRKGA